MNRASLVYKKEIEAQKQGESDEEARKSFKMNGRRIKDSIITNLFVGQFKKPIKYISCGTVYDTFPDLISLNIHLIALRFS